MQGARNSSAAAGLGIVSLTSRKGDYSPTSELADACVTYLKESWVYVTLL